MNMNARGPIDDSVAAARAYFPRGLVQPVGSFRFSVDALLLAAFVSQSVRADLSPGKMLELGTGCGVVSLALLLDWEAESARSFSVRERILGVDIDPDLVRAANENAVRLGLSGVFRALCADVTRIGEECTVPPESRDVVIANPPYRDPGSGRLPCGERRTAALFADEAGLHSFVRAAAYALRTRGRFFCVLGAERIQEAIEHFVRNRLIPKRLKPVYGAPGKNARIVLMEARKNSRPGLILETPLVLYTSPPEPVLTYEALTFCPWLTCNARRCASG